MPKKANWLPNLRVDIPDFEQGTHTYSDEKFQQIQATLKDEYPRVAEGFRCEIADAANKVITVYNGYAVDQNGDLVSNSETITTSRSLTLGADATYYIEIEYVENTSDTDARGFWDPTFDNGLDTSGDTIPDGREFSQNVATRKTLDWQLVNPPSTSGFDISSSPSSTKIPVAIIVVSGGAITSPATTVPARSVLARGYASAVSSIRLVNTRIFPNAFTLRLDPGGVSQEDVSVTANDRTNGILTLAAPTANAHGRGTRGVDVSVGASQFTEQRVKKDQGPIQSTAGDARIRMFQGDAEKGYALSQDPDANTGESDIQIRSLKEYVDFLASQVQEMKYGAGAADLLGTLAPPSSFTVQEHYSRSGGIIPARTNTVSVGDGVTSWGDYNTTTSGSARDAINSAIAAVPANGGIVYIKEGTYDLVNTGISINSNVSLVGDGRDATIIRCTGTAGISFDSAGVRAVIRDLSLTHTAGGALAVLQATDTATLDVQNCVIHGISSGTFTQSSFFRCAFVSNPTLAACFQGSCTSNTFVECSFTNNEAVAGARCLDFTSATNSTFRDCSFAGNTTLTALVELPASADTVVFDNCKFTQATGNATAVVFTAAGGTDIYFEKCDINCVFGVGTFDNCDNVRLAGCTIAVPQDDSSVLFDGTGVGAYVESCVFTQATTDVGTTGVALDFVDAASITVSNCRFVNCDMGIYLYSVERVFIDGCSFECAAGRGRSGIETATNGTPPANSNWTNVVISNSVFSGLSDTNVASIHGVRAIAALASSFEEITVSGCHFYALGDSSLGNTSAYATRFETSGVTSSPVFYNVSVSNCDISVMTATTNIIGILFENVRMPTANGNRISGLGTTATAVLVVEAVQAVQCDVVNISNNIIRAIGDVTKTATPSGGIIHVGASGQTTQNDAIVISNNTFEQLYTGGALWSVIFCEDNAGSVAISGNVIAPRSGSGIFAGIRAVSSSDSVAIANMAITGNVISSEVDTGISMLMDDPTSGVEGKISISGNSIDAFITTGILVVGDSVTATSLESLAITGNTVRSSATTASMRGIRVQYGNHYSVTGNTVALTATSGSLRYAIHLQNSREVMVASNKVDVRTTSTAAGIFSNNCLRVFGAANNVVVDCTNVSTYCMISDGTMYGLSNLLRDSSGNLRYTSNVVDTGGPGYTTGNFTLT